MQSGSGAYAPGVGGGGLLQHGDATQSAAVTRRACCPPRRSLCQGVQQHERAWHANMLLAHACCGMRQGNKPAHRPCPGSCKPSVAPAAQSAQRHAAAGLFAYKQTSTAGCALMIAMCAQSRSCPRGGRGGATPRGARPQPAQKALSPLAPLAGVWPRRSCVGEAAWKPGTCRCVCPCPFARPHRAQVPGSSPLSRVQPRPAACARQWLL